MLRQAQTQFDQIIERVEKMLPEARRIYLGPADEGLMTELQEELEVLAHSIGNVKALLAVSIGVASEKGTSTAVGSTVDKPTFIKIE